MMVEIYSSTKTAEEKNKKSRPTFVYANDFIAPWKLKKSTKLRKKLQESPLHSVFFLLVSLLL